MRVVTIDSIKELENKEPIPSVRGTITKVFDYKTGESSQGPWSLQNGFFKDSTGELKILFTNQPDAKSFQEKEVIIKSHSGDKGLSGVYASDDTYKGETKRIIKITATADIAFVDSARSAQGGPAKSTSKTSGDSVEAYKSAFTKVANAIYLNYLGLDKLATQLEIDGVKLTQDQIQAAAASAFISLERGGLVSALPDEPLWSGKKQLEEDEIPF